MATRKQTKPERFFQRELPGEQAPSIATMERLYASCADLFSTKPWNVLSDTDLVLVEDSHLHETCYCCIMGQLGEVFSLHVFIGDQGFGVYQAIQASDPNLTETIFTAARAVYAELVDGAEVTAADRSVLVALGHPPKPNTLNLIFRTMRPGYHPWHVTELEAQLLDQCARGVSAMLDHLKTNPKAKYWEDKKAYPLAVQTDSQYVFKVVKPKPARNVIEMPAIDAARVNVIQKAGLAREGVLEVDQFSAPATVGKKHERKACMSVALAADAVSGFVHEPNIDSGKTNGQALSDVLLSAIEATGVIPAEVHVRDRDRKRQLDRLAKELGFRLRSSESLPALDSARDALFGMMQGQTL